jgi:ABC-type sugar transport system ATPase subunit
VREDIREIQQRIGITTVFVTHDQDEALSISDRIAVMSGGKVEQYADPRTLYREPATRFVASFVGAMNFYRAALDDGAIELGDGTRIPCDGVARNGGSPVEVGVRPEDVSVDGDGVEATVVREIPRGHYKELVLSVGGDEVRAFVGPEATPSDRVRIRFTRAVVYGDEAVPAATA